MTNEKAIDLLRHLQSPEDYTPLAYEEVFEALEMAIKALGTDINVGGTVEIKMAGLCKGCEQAELEVECQECSSGLQIIKLWSIHCKHNAACERMYNKAANMREVPK